MPQAQHGTMLRIVTTGLNTWLQAIAAGAQRAAAPSLLGAAPVAVVICSAGNFLS